MRSLVFFPGKHLLDGFGAVPVIISNLFPDTASDIKGSIIGMRHFVNPQQSSPALTQIDLLPQYLRRSTPYRAVSKACRVMWPAHPLSLGVQRWIDERMSIIADNLAAKEVKALFRRKPDAKIALGLSSMSLAFGRAAKAAGKRYALHCQWSHPYVQNALVADGYRALGLAPPPVSRTRIRRQLAEFELADAIWCASEFVRCSLVDNGVPEEKTFVSYYGVDVESFRVPEDARQSPGPFQILFVGSLIIRKGIHVLLDALSWADLPDATLILNGKADAVVQRLLAEHRPRLAEKGISLRVDPGDPRRYHKTASVLVLPSLEEAYGIVVPEAMAAGLPIIISDHVGAREVVKHGENGFIFPSGNSMKLSEHLEFFYQHPEAREAFGRASEDMSGEYDVKHTAERILAALI